MAQQSGIKILIAEDDRVSRTLLDSVLQDWGYEVVIARNGVEALDMLQRKDAPNLAILDWMMPEMDGTAVCKSLREFSTRHPIYIILLTARGRKEDIIAGLEAGADDYVTKPFDREELHARVKVGLRIVELQKSLATRVRELEGALEKVKTLSGLLPICSYCKRIRNDENYWQQLELYLGEHSGAEFSHSICPDCFEKYAKPEMDE